MSDEIEDFLRRAAARRQQRQGGQQRAPQPPPPQQPPQRQPLRPQVPEIQIVEPIAEVEIVEAMPVDDQSVSAHVQQHLNTSDFAERASHLGERVGRADDKMEAHLQDVFDHKLGSLAASRKAKEKRESAKAAQQAQLKQSAPLAQSILDLMRSPQSIRQAIILSEILTRPEDRW